MNKNGEINYAGIIVITAICIMIGTSLLVTTAGSVGQMQNKYTVTNETINIIPARTGALASVNASYWFDLAQGCPQTNGNWRLSDKSDCALSGISMVFANGSAMVLNTDYKVNSTAGVGFNTCNHAFGDIAILNSTGVFYSANSTRITYTYCQDGYIPTNNSGARAMLPLILMFFVLLIMAISLVPIFR